MLYCVYLLLGSKLMKIAVVHGYGLYSPERKDYEGYLDFIAQEIHKEKFDRVILCGGFTVPEYPDKSEASTAREYLKTKVDFDNYILEDRSINTNQNLEFAAEHLKEFNDINEIVIYGDYTRLAKIIWIAMHFILKIDKLEIYKSLLDFVSKRQTHSDFRYKNLTVRSYDFDKSKEETVGGGFTAVLDVMALYDQQMNELDVQQRKKEFGLS